MQETSLLAYRSLNIPERQRQVYDALVKAGTACSKDLSDSTGIPPNVVTPRVLELRELGVVVQSHKAVNPSTNRTSIYWKAAA